SLSPTAFPYTTLEEQFGRGGPSRSPAGRRPERAQPGCPCRRCSRSVSCLRDGWQKWCQATGGSEVDRGLSRVFTGSDGTDMAQMMPEWHVAHSVSETSM